MRNCFWLLLLYLVSVAVVGCGGDEVEKLLSPAENLPVIQKDGFYDQGDLLATWESVKGATHYVIALTSNDESGTTHLRAAVKQTKLVVEESNRKYEWSKDFTLHIYAMTGNFSNQDPGYGYNKEKGGHQGDVLKYIDIPFRWYKH